MKTWLKSGEWQNHANCLSDSRFLISPERLTEGEADDVEYLCHTCNVRPECIKHCVDTESSGVWCASVFIPEISIPDSPKRAKEILEEAAKVRGQLKESLPEEIKRRGEF
ncbi:MAG: hypothetical protein A4E20_11065 [Nitrospira sp. SG-bin2]|nr:MAG: hypothetical protein A4E20_11065 [Nitrospira sp. SG-bin2]